MQAVTPFEVPDQFSQVYGLGTPLGYFPVKNLSRWGVGIIAIILLGGAGVAFLFGIYDGYVQTQRYGPAVLERTVLPPMIFAIIAFLIGVGLALSAFFNWKKAALVYEHGLAYSDRDSLEQWRWEEVEEFFVAITKHYTNGIYTGTTHIYTLRKRDGSTLKFDNRYKQVETLGKLISRAVAPIQYKRLLEKVKLGQTVTLGPITINREQLSIKKKMFSWGEIEQVGIRRGTVSIKKKDGGWFSGATAAVSTIPNLDAFLQVVDQIVSVKTG